MAAAFRTVTLVVGGAGGGSYLYNNVSPEGLRSVVRDFLLRERARDAGAAGAAHGTGAARDDGVLDRLATQVERLSTEVSSSASRQVVVYGGGQDTGWSTGSVAGWTVVGVTVGTAVYYFCLWKGVSMTDFMWVSRNAFKSTVSGINASMKSVSASVTTIKQDMADKMRSLEFRMESVRAGLSKKVETEVADVKDRVDVVGREVSDTAETLQAVNNRIETMHEKIDHATKGIMALVNVVSSLAPEKLRPDSPFVELRRFAECVDNDGLRAIDGSTAFTHRRLPSSNASLAAATLDGLTEHSRDMTRRSSTPHVRTFSKG